MKIKSKLLLTPKDFEPLINNWEIDGIFNPSAVRMKDGRIMLYVRVAESSLKHKQMMKCPVITSKKDYQVKHEKINKKNLKLIFPNGFMLKEGTCRLTNLSHFRRVILDKNGFKIEKIEQKPIFTGILGDGEYGVEDPRIIKINKEYYMSYVSVSINEGISTSLATSRDLKKWKRLGIIFREQNKDVVLFPEKIKGKYVALHRPEGSIQFKNPSIWISYSPDLIYWGKEKSIIQPRIKSWDSSRIGAGSSPIKTKKGWLLVYHGVEKKKNKNIYSAGAVLMDLKNPEKIIARTPKNKPFLSPKEKYEKKGFMKGVVFPTGIILDNNQKDLLIYSGGADKYISVKKVSINDIINSLKKSDKVVSTKKITQKGRALFLAYDQGLEHGPTDFNDKNVDPRYIIDIAEKGEYQGIVFQKGIAEKYSKEIKKSKIPLIVKLNGKTNLFKGEPISRQLCTVEEAIKLGASAVGYTIYIGSDYEDEMMQEFEKIQRKAHKARLPVIVWIYPRGKSIKGKKKTELMAYAARTGLEIGADIIKIRYDGDLKDLKWAVKSAGRTKVVVAGGVKKGEAALLNQVKEIIDAGCIGLAIGRNIWQNKDPIKITNKIKKMIWK